MRILKPLFAAGLAASVGLTSAWAGLGVPYTPDGDTLHLWHFDDSIANQGTASFVTVTDAVTSGLNLTNYGLSATSSGSAPNQPPYTNIFLVSQAATANLGKCLNILPGGGSAGKAYAYCGLTNSGGYLTDASSFRNGTSGAFTLEALVYIQGSVFSSSIGSEWEILSGDNQGDSGFSRAWVGSSRVDLQACKLEYSIVSPK